MKVLFLRHGETDYGVVEARGVRGWATSFAPLTSLGRLQIDTIARDYRLQEADAILCSDSRRRSGTESVAVTIDEKRTASTASRRASVLISR